MRAPRDYVRLTLRTCWKNMHARCTRRQRKDFARYGGSGISVCAEWSDFEAFKTWALGAGWRNDLSIDRIDGSRGYSPQNCRWATVKQQNINRKNVPKNADGVPYTQLAKLNGITEWTYRARLRKGWSRERAATTPTHRAAPGRRQVAEMMRAYFAQADEIGACEILGRDPGQNAYNRLQDLRSGIEGALPAFGGPSPEKSPASPDDGRAPGIGQNPSFSKAEGRTP